MILLFSLLLFILNILGSCKLPVKISPVVVTDSAGDGICSPSDLVRSQLNRTKEEVKQAIRNTVNPYLNQAVPSNPCHGSGWRRVAYLNMSDPSAICPSSWTTINSPVRGCGRTSAGQYTCDSSIIPVSDTSYSTVCGRILGYQKGSTDAFENYVYKHQTTIESAYVDGVSVTHGSVGSRQHIWTFAAAFYEEDPTYATRLNCPCTNTQHNWPHQIPPFIQNNYFCDTGNPGPGYSFTDYYTSDPLWDGAGCGANSTCCQLNNPPWFKSTLPQGTTDDIELRICHGEHAGDEDTVIFTIEIYVQ